MPSQFWTAPAVSPTGEASAGATLNTSLTLTDISPLPQATTVAGQLYAGAVIRVTAWGVFGTTSTPALLLGVYYGGAAGTALCTTGAVTTTTTVTNVPWILKTMHHVRTVGASGTIFSSGFALEGASVSTYQTNGATVVWPLPATANTSAVTVDTTASKILTVAAQWGTSNSLNTITCNGCIVEFIG